MVHEFAKDAGNRLVGSRDEVAYLAMIERAGQDTT
jgi:hypothetical protein